MKSRYNINHWTIPNPNFLTEKELKQLYTTLRQHMMMVYGRWDEDIIQMTILRGLWKSNMYNPAKASKLVWFQSILRFQYLQEIEQVKKRSRGIQLDWCDDRDEWDPHESIKDEVDEYDQDIQDMTATILEIIDRHDWFLIKSALLGKGTQDMMIDFNLTRAAVVIKLNEEKEQLKKIISINYPEWEYLLEGRIKLGMFNGFKEKVCPICNDTYQGTAGELSTRKYCSHYCARKAALENIRKKRKKD